MVFTNLTMNLSALQNITPPNISISNSNVLSSIISNTNSLTNNLFIFSSMFIILLVVYISLSDKTPEQNFGFGDIRALNLSFATSLIIGLEMVMVGWSPNFFAVGMFTSLWLLSFILIQIYENKE